MKYMTGSAKGDVVLFMGILSIGLLMYPILLLLLMIPKILQYPAAFLLFCCGIALFKK